MEVEEGFFWSSFMQGCLFPPSMNKTQMIVTTYTDLSMNYTDFYVLTFTLFCNKHCETSNSFSVIIEASSCFPSIDCLTLTVDIFANENGNRTASHYFTVAEKVY